jgi:thioredoxin reductase
VTRYGGEIVAGEVVTAEHLTAEHPTAGDSTAKRWGRDVLHCPYCHGWEVRDQPIAVLATGPLSVHQALLWRQWSDDVTYVHHSGPRPSAGEREQLAARGIAVVEGPAAALEAAGDRLAGVRLADGRSVPCQALVVAPWFAARDGAFAGLGLKPADQEMNGHVIGSRVEAGPSGETGVPGVWVAGNVASAAEQVVGSAAAGVRAGAAINADLVAEEARRAVAALRAG